MFIVLHSIAGSVLLFCFLILVGRARYNHLAYLNLSIIPFGESIYAFYSALVVSGTIEPARHELSFLTFALFLYCYGISSFMLAMKVNRSDFWRLNCKITATLTGISLLVWLLSMLDHENMQISGLSEQAGYLLAIYAFAIVALLVSLDPAMRTKVLKPVSNLLRVFSVAAAVITLPNLLSLVAPDMLSGGLPRLWYLFSSLSWDLSLFWWMAAIILVSPFRLAQSSEREVVYVDKSGKNEKTVHQQNRATKCSQTANPINQELIERFDQYIKRRDVYSDLNTSLSSVAMYLGTSSQTLSTTINSYYQKNFRTLLNQIRIKALLKSMITSQSKPNFIELAFQYGFSSKASFNRVFKQQAGVTPTEYYRSVQRDGQKMSLEKRFDKFANH